MLMHAVAHGGGWGGWGVRTPYVLKVDSGRKIPCRTRGLGPASAASRSDALPTELHPHPHPTVRKPSELYSEYHGQHFSLAHSHQRRSQSPLLGVNDKFAAIHHPVISPASFRTLSAFHARKNGFNRLEWSWKTP